MTCAHDACTCTVEGSSYCSDHCEQQMAMPTEDICQCGHTECVGTATA